MEPILENVKEELLRPSKNTLRFLVIALNIVYIICTTFFLTSEKIAEGNFVPIAELFYIAFLPALLLNFISLLYNIIGLNISDKFLTRHEWAQTLYKRKNKLLFKTTSWASVVSVMLMSFTHMNGFGNPSNDAIITDYALAHSLIMVGVIVMGRKAATVWCLVVVATLLFNVNKMGWNYKFHYLTTKEAVEYEDALANNEKWAVEREDILKKEGLNPPKISRYFNTWLIFIVIAYFGAFFYSGITTDILKMLPSVVNKIEKSIDQGYKVKSALQFQQKEINFISLRMQSNSELLDKILNEFDKLDYKEKKKFKPIMNLIKYELAIREDWERLKTNFNSINNDFFTYTKKRFPALSDNDIRHLIYIRMNLDNVDIAQLMNVKLDSLRKHRYRLKGKLGLANDQDLYEYLKNIIIQKQYEI